MDLIDRYLNAIRRNLPRDKADDIVAELRDVIASRVEDREDSLGRALTPEEVKALLKEFGHPLVVASRYRTQQWLIGPDVYPFYLSVLRIVLTLTAVALAAGAIVSVLFNGHDPVRALAGIFGSLWVSVLASAAIVTLVFAILERSGFPGDHLRRWDPAQLPDLADKQPGPWEAAIEVALSAGFLLWWSGLIHIPYSAGGRGFVIVPAPIFTDLYWAIFALVAARLVHNLIQWLRPRWRMTRAALATLTAIGGLALLAFLYRADKWALVVPSGMAPAKAIELQASLNTALRIAIVVAAVVWTFQVLHGLYRLWLGRDRRPAAA